MEVRWIARKMHELKKKKKWNQLNLNCRTTAWDEVYWYSYQLTQTKKHNEGLLLIVPVHVHLLVLPPFFCFSHLRFRGWHDTPGKVGANFWQNTSFHLNNTNTIVWITQILLGGVQKRNPSAKRGRGHPISVNFFSFVVNQTCKHCTLRGAHSIKKR